MSKKKTTVQDDIEFALNVADLYAGIPDKGATESNAQHMLKGMRDIKLVLKDALKKLKRANIELLIK